MAQIKTLNSAQEYYLYLASLLLLGLLTRLWYYGYPNASIIDEVNFGKYLSSYFTGNYYFDTHPPLGKLIIAGFVALFDFEAIPWNTDWTTQLPYSSYLSLRALPTIFGVIFPPLLFLLVFRLFNNMKLAWFIALLAVFDNALMTQSRFLFYDIFLLTFGFASFLCYLIYQQGRSLKILWCSGLLAALAVSVKWTGLSFVALPIAMELFLLYVREGTLKSTLHTLIAMLLSLAFIYCLIFATHFALLPQSGSGDGFMSPAFQSELKGSQFEHSYEGEKPGFLDKVIETNLEMYKANKRMADHPYGSPWYDWPLGRKAIGYWLSGDKQISLQPNLLVWWSSSLAMLVIILFLITNVELLKDYRLLMIVAGFLMNWIPFAFVGRVMFLHSYFTALIFTFLSMAWLINRYEILNRYYLWLLLPFTGGFLYFAGISYGI